MKRNSDAITQDLPHVEAKPSQPPSQASKRLRIAAPSLQLTPATWKDLCQDSHLFRTMGLQPDDYKDQQVYLMSLQPITQRVLSTMPRWLGNDGERRYWLLHGLSRLSLPAEIEQVCFDLVLLQSKILERDVLWCLSCIGAASLPQILRQPMALCAVYHLAIRMKPRVTEATCSLLFHAALTPPSQAPSQRTLSVLPLLRCAHAFSAWPAESFFSLEQRDNIAFQTKALGFQGLYALFQHPWAKQSVARKLWILKAFAWLQKAHRVKVAITRFTYLTHDFLHDALATFDFPVLFQVLQYQQPLAVQSMCCMFQSVFGVETQALYNSERLHGLTVSQVACVALWILIARGTFWSANAGKIHAAFTSKTLQQTSLFQRMIRFSLQDNKEALRHFLVL